MRTTTAMRIAALALAGAAQAASPAAATAHGAGQHTVPEAAPAPAPDAATEAARVQALAEQAYIFGLPIVINYAVLHASAVDPASPKYKAPFNQFKNIGRVFTHEDTAVVTPNSDTPYSFAALDLRAEPVVITVPPVPAGRYYSVMLCDGSTYNFGLIGSIATGGVPGAYLVVAPGWKGKVPAGIRQVFRSGSDLAMALIRTQLRDAADIGNVQAVQAGYQVQALSAWQGKPAPAPAPAIAFPPAGAQSVQRDFFALLDFALRFIPATPDERQARAQLAQLGIGAGDGGARWRAIAAHYPQAIAAGVAAGDARIQARVLDLGKKVNGWNLFLASGGDRRRYHGDWTERAAVAKAGIYAIDISEAQYALTRTTADGAPLDGRRGYTLTFDARDMPPASAFWSVTMYDGASQLLVNNPINRYLVNSGMLDGLQRNPDGSLTIHISHAAPPDGHAQNWLPAPAGPIYLALRLYGPQPRALRGEWQVPAVKQIQEENQ